METTPEEAPKGNGERLLKLKKGNVFFAILLTIISLGIYVPYWFIKRQEAFNQLDSEKKFSKRGLIILFILFASTEALGFLFPIHLNPNLPFHVLVIHLVHLGCWIFIIILALRARRILLDHMGTHYRVVSKISGVLTFLFYIYYLQYKINRIHKWPGGEGNTSPFFLDTLGMGEFPLKVAFWRYGILYNILLWAVAIGFAFIKSFSDFTFALGALFTFPLIFIYGLFSWVGVCRSARKIEDPGFLVLFPFFIALIYSLFLVFWLVPEYIGALDNYYRYIFKPDLPHYFPRRP